MKHIFAGFILIALVSCQNNPTIADDETPIQPGSVSIHPQIRGANISFNSDTWPTLTETAFDTWQDWGIQLVRFTFDKDDFTNVRSDAPDPSLWRPYTENIAQLKKVLGWMKARGMKAMISLDHIWGDDHNSQAMWENGGDNAYLSHRTDLSGAMASWIAENGFTDVVRYLELWNEPYPCDTALYATKFLPEAISAVRNSAYPGITISVMPPHHWGLLWGFEGWNGVNDTNVVYSTHIYAPQTYTHQGVSSGYPILDSGWPGYYKNYPSDPFATYCDSEAGRALMEPLASFEARSGKEVIVTEFGVARWARGAGQWVRDLVSLMEEYGIDWLYHGMAGWNGWNPGFKASDPESKEVFGSGSPTLELLKYYWAH